MKEPETKAVDTPDLSVFAPPFVLRVGSALVDYIIFLSLPLAGLVSDQVIGGNGFGLFSDRTIWLLTCVIGFINCVVLPQFSGQSIGKMLTGIRIVRSGGGDIGRMQLFVRQTLGYVLTLATFGIGFFIAIVLPNGRTLHDLITGTSTVRAYKTLVRT